MTAENTTACPKCAAERSAAAESCARCGLVFSRWNPEAADKVKPLDEKAGAMWGGLAGNWSDEARHAEFLKYCSAAGLLGAAGRAYRDRLRDKPGDELALAMQKRILGMASALLGPHAQPPAQSFMRSGTFLAVLLTCAVVGMVGAFIFMGRR